MEHAPSQPLAEADGGNANSGLSSHAVAAQDSVAQQDTQQANATDPIIAGDIVQMETYKMVDMLATQQEKMSADLAGLAAQFAQLAADHAELNESHLRLKESNDMLAKQVASLTGAGVERRAPGIGAEQFAARMKERRLAMEKAQRAAAAASGSSPTVTAPSAAQRSSQKPLAQTQPAAAATTQTAAVTTAAVAQTQPTATTQTAAATTAAVAQTQPTATTQTAAVTTAAVAQTQPAAMTQTAAATAAAEWASPSTSPGAEMAASSAQAGSSSPASSVQIRRSLSYSGPDHLAPWCLALPSDRLQEVQVLPECLKLRSYCKRRQVNLGIKDTKWVDRPPDLPVWRCVMNVHHLQRLNVHASQVYVPPRMPGNRKKRSITSPHLFTMLLKLDFVRVKGNDMPRDPPPEWKAGQTELGAAQASKVQQPDTQLPYDRLPDGDGTAAASWVTYTSRQLWDAFLQHTGHVVAPEGFKPHAEIRWQLHWHGPEPEAMEKAADMMGVVCTFQNWRDVYDRAVALSLPPSARALSAAAAFVPSAVPSSAPALLFSPANISTGPFSGGAQLDGQPAAGAANMEHLTARSISNSSYGSLLQQPQGSIIGITPVPHGGTKRAFEDAGIAEPPAKRPFNGPAAAPSSVSAPGQPVGSSTGGWAAGLSDAPEANVPSSAVK